MQISDAQVEAALEAGYLTSPYKGLFGKDAAFAWADYKAANPDIVKRCAIAMKASLEAALSLPVQPVAKRWLVEETLEGGSIKWNCVEHEHHARSMVSPVGNPVTVTPLYTTPPVPPTKGPEDDLIAALEFYADRANWTNDEQVNRDEIFDTAMSLDEHGSRARAALLARRSRPASALPVVERAAIVEECAKIAEQNTDTYNEGMSAVDVRFSITRGPRWRDGQAIAAAIRSALTPSVRP